MNILNDKNNNNITERTTISFRENNFTTSITTTT